VNSIAQFMKREVVAVSPSTTVRQAARTVVEWRVGTLPVVEADGVLIGVVRVADLLHVFMPDFVDLLQDIDFVHDFGALEALAPRDVPQAATLTMRDIMCPAVAVQAHCGLLRAFATMVKHEILDLPVVDGAGRLAGIASRVDIAAAFLGAWTQEGTSP